jgi:hypothetical protein
MTTATLGTEREHLYKASPENKPPLTSMRGAPRRSFPSLLGRSGDVDHSTLPRMGGPMWPDRVRVLD